MNTTLHYGMAFVVFVLLSGMGFLVYKWSVRGILTIEILKMMFGFCLLFMIIALAAIIALGNVEEKTSAGLTQVLTVISVLSGSFAQWAFSAGKHDSKEQKANDSN